MGDLDWADVAVAVLTARAIIDLETDLDIGICVLSAPTPGDALARALDDLDVYPERRGHHERTATALRAAYAAGREDAERERGTCGECDRWARDYSVPGDRSGWCGVGHGLTRHCGYCDMYRPREP